MNTPKVSVCMPVYNGSEYIKEAIDSILNQSFSDFEFIIVDDNSTDGTLDLINSYEDKRIKIFKNPRRLGQLANYNKSINYGRGKYVKLIQCDDTLNPRCLELQTKALDENPAVALVFNDSYLINNKSQLIFERNLSFKREVIEKGQILKGFLFQPDFNFIGEASVPMLRKDTYDKLGGFNEGIPLANDIELWARINLEYKCYYINTALANIRIHDKQSLVASRESIRYALADNYQLFNAILSYKNISRIWKIALYMEFVGRIPLLLLGRLIKKMFRIPPEILLLYCLKKIKKKLFNFNDIKRNFIGDKQHKH